MKTFEKPITIEPKIKIEARASRWGAWMELLLLFIGLAGYLLCNATALQMSIAPLWVVLLGGIIFAAMIRLAWYKRIFFGALGVGALFILFSLRYILSALKISLNYIIYLLGSQEGYSGYLDQMTIDLEPYLKNQALLNRYLMVAMVLSAIIAGAFFALAFFKRIPVMVAYIVPAVMLVPLFYYGIVPHYLPFCLFLSSLIGCYGQSLVQQMGRVNKRKANRLKKQSFRKEKKKKRAKGALTTEQRLAFASANGQFGIIVAIAMLVVTIGTALVIYSCPILQMDAFREKLDQISVKAMNVVFRKAYDKQLNVAGEMEDGETIQMMMPAWRGLEVAEISTHTDHPFYLRYRTGAELTPDGWAIPDRKMLADYEGAVDYDFYEYMQYYEMLCMTAESGDPIAAALDNNQSEDQGYLTDQVTVYPKYKVSNLLGLPQGITAKLPISEYEDLEREGDTILMHHDDPSERGYTFRVVSPTFSSGVYLATFDSKWSKYLQWRSDHGDRDPYMSREQEYSNFVNAYYTQNPEEVKGIIGNLAWDISSKYESKFAKVQSIERYFRENYTYSDARTRVVRMDGTPGDAYDYLQYFLYENKDKNGYCTLFATAMTVLLRDMGMPARVATGYYVQPEWTDVEYYTATLEDSDYHSWVEVYFEGFGWIAFEPTPGYGETKNYYLLEVADGVKEESYETESEVEYVPNDKYKKYTNVLPEPTIPEEEEDLSDTIMDALKLNRDNLVAKTIIQVILWLHLLAAILLGIHFLHRMQLRRALRGTPLEGTAKAYQMILRLMQMRGFKFFEGETLAGFAERADNLQLAPLSLSALVPFLEKSLYSDLSLEEIERRAVTCYLFELDKALMRRTNPIKALWYRLTLWKKPKYKGMIWRFK